MTFRTSAIAAALAGALCMAMPAAAQQLPQKPPPRPPVIINDPSLYRSPPPPHQRDYVGPQPSLAPPMERLQQPPPLAQPPVR